MDSANHQWLQELEEKDDVEELLEFIDPLSMQKLAESLASEIWGQPPQDEQQEQQDHDQRQQCVHLDPSLTTSSFVVADTTNIMAQVITGISNNALSSFTGGSSSCPLSSVAKEYGQQSLTGATMPKYGSPSQAARRGGGRRSTSSVREHVIAERKRRETMHHQFSTLASIVPDITKTDKVSLLGSTIEYVLKLKDRLKELQDELQGPDDTSGKTAEESPAFHTRCRTGDCGEQPNDDDDAVTVRPKVEVDVQGATVLLRVVCRAKQGVLVKVLMELEKHGISVVNTSVVPFAESLLNITITAQMEDGSSTATELVKAINLTLRNF